LRAYNKSVEMLLLCQVWSWLDFCLCNYSEVFLVYCRCRYAVSRSRCRFFIDAVWCQV